MQRNENARGGGPSFAAWARRVSDWRLRQEAACLAAEAGAGGVRDGDEAAEEAGDETAAQLFGMGLPAFAGGVAWATLFNLLIESGVALPVPQALDADGLSRTLGEAIAALATVRVYLENTNHLSDRALYEKLWSEVLREEYQHVAPANREAIWLDMVGGEDDAEIEAYLRYYAPPVDRTAWARDFPGDPIPPHEDPPHDRDRHLPGATANDPAPRA